MRILSGCRWRWGLAGGVILAAALVYGFMGGFPVLDLSRILAGQEDSVTGFTRGWLMVAIFFGTFVSEDLTCIAAGLLAATGRIDFLSATAASYAGILVGDSAIFALGYFYGRPLLLHRWARWIVSERSLARAGHLFHRHGVWIVLLSRFIPGTRTATYFSAGAIHAPALVFLGVFALASLIWTPLLVGLSFFLGRGLVDLYATYEAFALPGLLFAGLVLYGFFNYFLPLLTWRGRRSLRGKWMRATRWEFWPAWQVNWVVVLYAIYLGFIRYRRPLLFTAVNPGMPHGGLLGESKGAILESLRAVGEALPPWKRIGPGELTERLAAYDAALAELGLSYPVVLKPDAGQRGLGVAVIRDRAAAEGWLRRTPGPVLLQAYIGGCEYGVFYVRQPGAARGSVVSVTLKEQLEVIGNGTDSLEVLILRHPRAVALQELFLKRFDARLEEVLPEGARLPLGELGTHALGSLFRDGRHLITPELEEAIERLARASDGFHFGRFDLKAPDEAALRAGQGIRIIELNGLTSEATHIYDPRYGLWQAWRTLAWQWRTAFAIAEANRRAGAPVSRFGDLSRDLRAAWREQKRIVTA